MKTGYFQYLWLLIWNKLIKNSFIYKALCAFYSWITSKWAKSKIASWFRRVDSDIEKGSVSNKILGLDIKILEKLGEKNEFFTKCKERSFLITACKYLLHNFLALNLRFMGILFGVWLGLYTILNYAMGGGFNQWTTLGAIFCGSIAVLNLNITDYIKPTLTSRIAEYFLGTELNYKFYYMTKCSKSRARYYCCTIFGALMALLSVFVHPLMGLLFIMGILFVSMVFYKVEFGVFVTAFLAPFIPTMVLAGLCVLCACSLVAKAITSKNFEWKFGIVGMFIMLMIFIYFVAALMSFARGKSIQIWFIYAVMIVFFYVVINTIRTKKQFFDLLKTFAVSGFFVCLYGIYQYIFKPGGAEAWIDSEMFEGISMRIYSTLENPNVLGEYILLVLPVCIGLMWTEKNWGSKIFWGALAAVMGIVLILTFSRGCWIALVVAAAIYVTFVCGKLWGLALLVLPIIPFVIPETILQRLTSVGDMSDSSTSYRVFIWMGSILMMKDFWLSGIGMGEEAFNAVYPFYAYSAVVAPHSHNLFLQVWIETGLGGIINFVLILFFWFKQLCLGHNLTQSRRLKTLMVSIGAAVCAFMVQGLFDNCFYNYRVVMVFWFILALGIAGVNIAKEETK
ncbi:MAG: O-antigen ligase family protein [Clostridia bacterium]|nr:O-antigen ligase family protein [Clostridia bacterium]